MAPTPIQGDYATYFWGLGKPETQNPLAANSSWQAQADLHRTGMEDAPAMAERLADLKFSTVGIGLNNDR